MKNPAPRPRRTLLGLTTFLPLAVLALIAPAKLQTGDPPPSSAGPASVVTQNPSAPQPGPSPQGTPKTPPRTSEISSSCDSVLYIGDSTSEGVISTNYLPRRADREKAQLQAVGVRTFIPEISGARAIIERYKGEPSGINIVTKYVAQGFRGCWVIALGNNDAANISIGARPGAEDRIDLVLNKIGDQPVLWVNTLTLVTQGPNDVSNMRAWNASLKQACTRHSNLRVYDWASEVQPDWFTPTDKIHYTTPGYRARSRGIARATGIAFPGNRSQPDNCLVSSN